MSKDKDKKTIVKAEFTLTMYLDSGEPVLVTAKSEEAVDALVKAKKFLDEHIEKGLALTWGQMQEQDF